MCQPDALCVCEFPIIHAEKMARYETSRQKPFLDRLHLEDPTDAIEARLMDELAKLTRTDVSGPTYTSLHRWRFASTQTAAGAPYLLDKDNRLAAGGDWCIRGRVEAAFTSARMLVDEMRQEIG